MEGADKPEKVAILGGGMAALATAFELTRDPNWRERFESITVYQLGWRLGGKCASSRGPCERIEEHGIHGFLGCYYNTLPMMAACYDELGRDPKAPLATFEQALIRQDYGMLWELRGRTVSPWPQHFPTNRRSPRDRLATHSAFELSMIGVAETLIAMLFLNIPLIGPGLKKLLEKPLERWAVKAGKRLASKGPHPTVARAYAFWRWLHGWGYYIARLNTKWRRTFLLLDHLLTMVAGALEDGVQDHGFDPLDDTDFVQWFERHGAHPETVKSAVNLNFINMTYQYPGGDTSLQPTMAAGCYVRWALLSTSYYGSFIWRFEAGSGETLIAPLYEVLVKRGVRFEFFQKVTALRLSEEKTTVAAVEINVQATLKDPATGYRPLKNVKGLPSWPHRPDYDQLVEGEEMRKFARDETNRRKYGRLDLESYWTAWKSGQPPRVLRHGQDYDRLVFGLSVGAVPHICGELAKANPAWKVLAEGRKLPTHATQAMQIWLSKSREELGWDINMKGVDAIFSTTFLNPQNGQAELRDLIRYENWADDSQEKTEDERAKEEADLDDYLAEEELEEPPEAAAKARAQAAAEAQADAKGEVKPPAKRQPPRGLWYFCGLLYEDSNPPGFDDHEYPKRQRARVKVACIQYLQSSMGILLPKASPDQNSPPGDPFGFDFDLLTDPRPTRVEGLQRFDCQFWRANIDPTERYVASPPGSTAVRMKAWDTGFANLVVTGDWIYTGINVGSVEGAVMGGRLAANALTGKPELTDIVGYLD